MKKVILEIIHLHILKEECINFEENLNKVKEIFLSAQGCIDFKIKKSIKEDKYIFCINWQSLEDSVEIFKNSTNYQEFISLIILFQANDITSEYYTDIYPN